MCRDGAYPKISSHRPVRSIWCCYKTLCCRKTTRDVTCCLQYRTHTFPATPRLTSTPCLKRQSVRYQLVTAVLLPPQAAMAALFLFSDHSLKCIFSLLSRTLFNHHQSSIQAIAGPSFPIHPRSAARQDQRTSTSVGHLL